MPSLYLGSLTPDCWKGRGFAWPVPQYSSPHRRGYFGASFGSGHPAVDIRTERPGLAFSCSSSYRALITATDDSEWVVRFEASHSGGQCDSKGCEVETIFSCGAAITLDQAVPADVTVRAVCEPEESLFATTVPGGAQLTLGPAPDKTEAVVCSPHPEAGAHPVTTIAPRDHLILELCVEPAQPPAADNATLLVAPTPVEIGQELIFIWDVDEAEDFIVGNEMVVSCWTGAGRSLAADTFDAAKPSASGLA